MIHCSSCNCKWSVFIFILNLESGGMDDLFVHIHVYHHMDAQKLVAIGDRQNEYN